MKIRIRPHHFSTHEFQIVGLSIILGNIKAFKEVGLYIHILGLGVTITATFKKDRHIIVDVETFAIGTKFAASCKKINGCIATGRTRKMVEKNYRDALILHLDGMMKYGDRLPRSLRGKYHLKFIYK